MANQSVITLAIPDISAVVKDGESAAALKNWVSTTLSDQIVARLQALKNAQADLQKVASRALVIDDPKLNGDRGLIPDTRGIGIDMGMVERGDGIRELAPSAVPAIQAAGTDEPRGVFTLSVPPGVLDGKTEQDVYAFITSTGADLMMKTYMTLKGSSLPRGGEVTAECHATDHGSGCSIGGRWTF